MKVFMETSVHKIEIEKTLMEDTNISECSILFLINSLESRLKIEKRKRFIIQSESLACGLYVEKTGTKIVILDIIKGDLYYNTGMLTMELTEYIKDKELN